MSINTSAPALPPLNVFIGSGALLLGAVATFGSSLRSNLASNLPISLRAFITGISVSFLAKSSSDAKKYRICGPTSLSKMLSLISLLTTVLADFTTSSKSEYWALALSSFLFQDFVIFSCSACCLRTASCSSLCFKAFSALHSANASAYSKASLNWLASGLPSTTFFTAGSVTLASYSFKRFSYSLAFASASSALLDTFSNRLFSLSFGFSASASLASSSACGLLCFSISAGSDDVSASVVSWSAKPNLSA